jgi:hypothetical protein
LAGSVWGIVNSLRPATLQPLPNRSEPMIGMLTEAATPPLIAISRVRS